MGHGASLGIGKDWYLAFGVFRKDEARELMREIVLEITRVNEMPSVFSLLSPGPVVG